MCYLIILTSGTVGLAYATEFFTAFYSGNVHEQFAFHNRAVGPLAWGFWLMVGCNVLIPQLLWFVRVRRSLALVFVISILVNVGMWFERFIIIVSSLERDFLPSSWLSYRPTSIEIATLVGSFGLFFTLFLLFCRFVPVIAIAEIKSVLQPTLHASPGADQHLEPESDPPSFVSRRRRAGGPYLVGIFDREEHLVQAAAAAREEGLEVVDAFAPYAVHGLRRAIGLAPSRLPWVCLLLGLAGTAAALGFQFWATAVSWPLDVGGKPWNSLPAFVPITFEVMVLFAGTGTVLAFLWVAGLRPGRPAVGSVPGTTDDRFALAVRGAGEGPAAIKALLSRFHVVSIEERAAAQ